MKKYSKFKKRLTAFLVLNGALGWLLAFIGTFMLNSYIANTPDVSDGFLIFRLMLVSYGTTAFLVAVFYVGIPLLFDASKDETRFNNPWGKSQIREQQNYVDYYDARTDKRNTIDILIVANNIFWLACIFDSLLFAYLNLFIIFTITAIVSSIVTAIFVFIPISKYTDTQMTVARKERIYGDPTIDPNDKYRMK